MANFMFFKNLGSQPKINDNLKIFYLTYGVLTLHAHVPLEGGFPEPVTVILPALVVSGVVLGLGHT